MATFKPKHDITSEHIPAAVAWRSSNSLNEVIKSSSSQRRDAAAVLAVLLSCVRVLQPQEEEACPVFSRGHLDVCQSSKGMKASGSLGNGGKEESCATGSQEITGGGEPGGEWRVEMKRRSFKGSLKMQR